MSRKKCFLNNGDKILFDVVNEGRLYTTYSLIAKNRFRWKNLPNGIDSYKIEEYLYNCGQVAFFKDESKGGFLCLPCTMNGDLNVYGQPLAFQATGINYSKYLKSDDMVWIRTNDDLYPNRLQVLHYTSWLDDIERTMRRNLQQLRQPYIVACDKDNELSMKNFMTQIENGENAIFYSGDRGYRGETPVFVTNFGVKNELESLQRHKDDIMYELLTFLGINNANTSKKERMIVDEVNVNNIHILMNLDVEYKNRQQACEEINKKFGLNIEVEMVIDELEHKFMLPDVKQDDTIIENK